MHLTPIEPFIPPFPNEHYEAALGVHLRNGGAYPIAVRRFHWQELVRYQAPLCGLFEEMPAQGWQGRHVPQTRTSVFSQTDCPLCRVRADEGFARGELNIWQSGSVVRPVPIDLVRQRAWKCWEWFVRGWRTGARAGIIWDVFLFIPDEDRAMYRNTIAAFIRSEAESQENLGLEASRNMFVTWVIDRCMGSLAGSALFV